MEDLILEYLPSLANQTTLRMICTIVFVSSGFGFILSGIWTLFYGKR